MTVRARFSHVPVAVILALLALAGGLLLSLYVALAADLRTQMRAELQADIRAVRAADRLQPAVAAIAVLDDQAPSGNGYGPRYILLDPETGAALAGTLPSWPRISLDAAGCGEAGTLIACTTRLDDHFPLLIARPTLPITSARSRILLGLGALVVLVPLIVAGAALVRMSAMRRRIEGIEAALDSFTGGELKARPPALGNDLVGRLADKIGLAMEKLAALIARQYVTAEQIAHELKRPVAMAAQMLQGTPSAERIDACREQMLEMNSLVNAILWVSTKSTDVVRVPIALDGLLASAVSVFAGFAAERGVRIDLELAEVSIDSEPDLLRTAFVNMLDNAIKFTASPGTVTVRCALQRGSATITIEDEGPGLSAFPPEPGYLIRGPAAAHVPGSGLGLAQAQRIMALLGGTLMLSDRKGRSGSMVALQLPLSHAASDGAEMAL
ncbi:sensor histidine kinase [Sphingomonas pituitosa]|uniref:sensor histidine kinase n=1 Tax=Sphingomonas pituitosa TaxID=99597 RepID=UPI0008361679|nr:ATP-binding protein [Sphingomonas pituitosa]